MKAVLVLDKMPETCGCCPCVSYNRQAKRWECNAELLCRERYATVKVVDTCTRPSWCPLKPLPKKKLVLERIVDGNVANDSEVAEARGYNKCLEDITNEP